MYAQEARANDDTDDDDTDDDDTDDSGVLYIQGLPLAIYTKRKEASVCGNLSFEWLGYPDSNQERQDQNLQCYHYTIPQTEILCRSKSLICGCKGSAFF